MPQKLIVTNQTALAKKYGHAAWTNIDRALGRLVTADAARAITTTVVRIDVLADMAPYSAAPVVNATSECQVKAAIDAAATNTPDYLLVLGAPDVVPHQQLNNPMTDGDPSVPSDLPYACTHPHSRSVTDFLAPSRVIGRLPDILNGNDPAYLVARIDDAAKAVPYSLADYLDDFTLGADVWHNSTATSAQNIFARPTVLLSPPMATPLAQPHLGPRAHFINCHGATADPHFYGENNGGTFPVAVSATDLAGNLQHGTVTAAECCYGAELYDPVLAGGAHGICQTYLEGGAYGFFGSTNIAYGPAIGNGAADLITQFFLREAITGSSLGRAELLARQTFVSRAGVLSPLDQKTLAQFLLLGDPSIHPVAPARPTTREAFVLKSNALSRGTAFATESAEAPAAGVVASLRALAMRAGMIAYSSTAYDVHAGDDYWALTPKVRGEQRIHVLVDDTTTSPDATVRPIRVIVAIEERGQLVASQKYFAKGSWRGSVVRKRVAHGSKSDRLAVVMVTDDGSREYVLRRVGGNPFRDPELDRIVGHRLSCEGEVSGQTLILSRFRIEDG